MVMNALAGIALSVLAVAAPPTSQSNPTANAPVRSAFEIRKSVDALIAKDAAATTTADRTANACEMISIASEITSHPTLGKHAAKSMHDRLASRLMKTAAELRSAKKLAVDQNKANAVVANRPQTISVRVDVAAILAQVGGGVPFGATANFDGAEALAELITERSHPHRGRKLAAPV
jgi:hypothetical protein